MGCFPSLLDPKTRNVYNPHVKTNKLHIARWPETKYLIVPGPVADTSAEMRQLLQVEERTAYASEEIGSVGSSTITDRKERRLEAKPRSCQQRFLSN